MPGYQFYVVDEAAGRFFGHHARSDPHLPMAAVLPATLVGAGRALQGSVLQTSFPVYYNLLDRLQGRRTAIVYVMGLTDDSSLSPATGSSLVAWSDSVWLPSHVAECAVLGIKDAIKGEVPCGFLC